MKHDSFPSESSENGTRRLKATVSRLRQIGTFSSGGESPRSCASMAWSGATRRLPVPTAPRRGSSRSPLVGSAQVDFDAEEEQRPDQDGNDGLADPPQGAEVVEVVVDRGHDEADDEIHRSKGDSAPTHTYPVPRRSAYETDRYSAAATVAPAVSSPRPTATSHSLMAGQRTQRTGRTVRSLTCTIAALVQSAIGGANREGRPLRWSASSVLISGALAARHTGAE
jgi:hypothetical protein